MLIYKEKENKIRNKYYNETNKYNKIFIIMKKKFKLRLKWKNNRE